MQRDARKTELDIELSEYIKQQMKWNMNGLKVANEPYNLTQQRQREELDNLHNFSRLFGTKSTLDSIVGQQAAI